MGIVESFQGVIGLSAPQTDLNTKKIITKFMKGITGGGLQEMEPERAVKTLFGTGVRGASYISRGKKHVEGNLSSTLFANSPMLQEALYLLMGSHSDNNTVSGGSTNGYTHVFTLTNSAAEQKGITVHQYLGKGPGGSDTPLGHDFLGLFVKSYKLSKPEDGDITVDVGFNGVKLMKNITDTPVPTFVDSDLPFNSSKAFFKFGSKGNMASVSDQKAETFDISFDNNLQFYSSDFPYSFSVGSMKTEITAQFRMDETMSLMEDFTNGVDHSLEIELQHDELSGIVNTSQYSVKFQFPRVHLLGDPVMTTTEGGAYAQTIKCEPVTPDSGDDTFFMKIIVKDKTTVTFG